MAADHVQARPVVDEHAGQASDLVEGLGESLRPEDGGAGSLYVENDPVLTGMRLGNAVLQAVYGGRGPLGRRPVVVGEGQK